MLSVVGVEGRTMERAWRGELWRGRVTGADGVPGVEVFDGEARASANTHCAEGDDQVCYK